MALLRSTEDTTDPRAAARTLGIMHPVVTDESTAPPIRYRHELRGDDSLWIGRFHFGVTGHLVGDTPDSFTTMRCIDGALHTAHGDAADGVMFAHEATEAAYHRADVVAVNLPESTLRRHCASRQGAETGVLRVHGHRPSPGQARLWATATDHVFNTMVSADECFTNDLIRSAAFDYLLNVAEATLPFEVTVRSSPSGSTGSAAVRRAIAHIEAHLDEPVTVPDIAAAARVSPRGLQSAFQRAYGKSPLTYVRETRVAAARDELLANGGTVRALAYRWGFSNPGRFSALYRELYGELPRETLERM